MYKPAKRNQADAPRQKKAGFGSSGVPNFTEPSSSDPRFIPKPCREPYLPMKLHCSQSDKLNRPQGEKPAGLPESQHDLFRRRRDWARPSGNRARHTLRLRATQRLWPQSSITRNSPSMDYAGGTSETAGNGHPQRLLPTTHLLPPHRVLQARIGQRSALLKKQSACLAHTGIGRSGRYEHDIPCGCALLGFNHFA